jgi:hypothetical protein
MITIMPVDMWKREAKKSSHKILLDKPSFLT